MNRKNIIIAAAVTAAITAAVSLPVAAQNDCLADADTTQIEEFAVPMEAETTSAGVGEERTSSIVAKGMPELTVANEQIPVDAVVTRNISYGVSDYKLSGGDKHAVSFDLSGWWGQPDHNKVSFVISDISEGSYAINLKNTTTGASIVSGEAHEGAYSFILNGTADNSYEFFIVNMENSDITYDLAITSYLG